MNPQVCEAVGAVHAAGVAHMDLKPHQFCFLKQSGIGLKLLDFDSARYIIGDKQILGIDRFTEQFCSPEVWGLSIRPHPTNTNTNTNIIGQNSCVRIIFCKRNAQPLKIREQTKCAPSDKRCSSSQSLMFPSVCCFFPLIPTKRWRGRATPSCSVP